MLVKLTTGHFHNFSRVWSGVNFINVKRTKNSYERRISAAFSSYMYVEKRRSYKIFVRITLMKLTTGRSETKRSRGQEKENEGIKERKQEGEER